MGQAARAPNDTVVVWEPQPGPQTALVTCPVFELMYGGARGGGKTDGMLGEFVSHAAAYGANAIGLMVRRVREHLVETIERSRALYGPLGAKYNEQEKMWRFPDGARLRFAFLERDADADAYQGHSYTRVYVEEIGQFPSPVPVLKLMATLRSGHGVPCGFRATGNPGGPGQHWVKARYIDPDPRGWRVINSTFTNPWTGESLSRERVFIPAKLRDNKYLGNEYVANLSMSGSAQLVKAWLEGDWNIVEGAFFDGWNTAKHVIAPFAIPDDWLRFRSMDWGYASPFSVGWWAVAGDDYSQEGVHTPHRADDDLLQRETDADRLQRPLILPRGALIRYREWYGCSSPNTGIRLTAEQVAGGILERTGQERIAYSVLDPSAFAQDGGPSIAERMFNAGVGFKRADNKRIAQQGALGGWDQMRARLRGDGDRPMLYVFSTCRDFIRTVPVLQHDPDKPEDLDTEQEDHAADECRYACMSRPWIPSKPIPPEEGRNIHHITIDEAWKLNEGGFEGPFRRDSRI